MSGPLPLLELFSQRDAPQLCGLTEHVGWGHTLEDWLDFLGAGEVFGHRATDGRIVSSTALFRYGDALDSIGIVIVHESQRRHGLARALMQHAMSLSRARVQSLIATAMGVPLYAGLGFVQISTVMRCLGVWQAGQPHRERVEPLDPADRVAALSLDRTVCGSDRAAVLGRLMGRALGACALRGGTSGALSGFGLALPKGKYVHIGPVIAPDEDGAFALVSELVRAVGGTGTAFQIDVPAERQAFARRLAAHGLPIVRSDPVMTRTGTQLPGERRQLHAISFQAFG